MVRLFEQLISEQHIINYRDFKEFTEDGKEEKLILSERISYLEKELAGKNKMVEELTLQKKKITLTGFTFKKVN